MFRILQVLVVMVLFTQFAESRTPLMAYDTYFCPVLELSEDQKAKLIPLIQQRHKAGHQDIFLDRDDATLFGVDLAESKASKDLSKPEDREVRKIINRGDARKVEAYLEENEDRLAEVRKQFPILEGGFLGVQQELDLPEAGSVSLLLTFEAQVPSAQYQLLIDTMKQEGEEVLVHLSIQKPHPFQLLEEAPQPQTISQQVTLAEPFPSTLRFAFREVAEFDAEREYIGPYEQPLLKLSDR